MQLRILKINLYPNILIEMHTNLLEVLQKNTDPAAVTLTQRTGTKSVLAAYLELMGCTHLKF
ncbi:MAG: hypothetical protein JEZ06_10250 [Anaerolineaceae bacterium]|nr:hypothetical protein [Anaerolineaceae bacterium]